MSSPLLTKTLQELTLSAKRGLSSYHVQKEGNEIKVPFIKIKNIRDGRVDASKVSTVHVKDTGALDKTKLEPADVIISIKGSTFKAAIADETVKDFVFSANLIAFTLNQEVLPEIVVTYFNSPEGQSELVSRSAGAAQKSLNLKSLMEIPIPIPDMEKQKVLAEYFQLSREHNDLIKREQKLRKKLNTNIMLNYMMGVGK